MAFVIVNHLAPDAVQFDSIPVTGYVSKHPTLIKTLQSKPQQSEMAFDEQKHAVIKEIKFHWEWCQDMNFNNGTIFSDIRKYWEGSYIAFDPDKGLETIKKFIENKSNKIVGKDNLFFIQKLVLKSTQTSKAKIEEYFEEIVKVNNQEKKLYQRVTVYNLKHRKGSQIIDHDKFGSLYTEMNETLEEILILQEKFINANLAFNKMFEEMQLRNLRSSTDLTKSFYKNQDKFKEWKFDEEGNGHQQAKDLPMPWEGKGIIDPETGKSYGDIEAWERDSLDTKKLINGMYDKLNEVGHAGDVDWAKHFRDYRGKGFMNGIVPFLREPGEDEV